VLLERLREGSRFWYSLFSSPRMNCWRFMLLVMRSKTYKVPVDGQVVDNYQHAMKEMSIIIIFIYEKHVSMYSGC